MLTFSVQSRQCKLKPLPRKQPIRASNVHKGRRELPQLRQNSHLIDWNLKETQYSLGAQMLRTSETSDAKKDFHVALVAQVPCSQTSNVDRSL